MWGASISHQQLRKSIDRLRSLNEVVEPPKENETVPQIGSAHRISVEREREIASSLAFLSATSDDNLNVMAVCIEEHPDGKGCTIRIASNSGEVSEAMDGFKELAKILEQAARRGQLLEILLKRTTR
jgi:hypothetical protein